MTCDAVLLRSRNRENRDQRQKPAEGVSNSELAGPACCLVRVRVRVCIVEMGNRRQTAKREMPLEYVTKNPLRRRT